MNINCPKCDTNVVKSTGQKSLQNRFLLFSVALDMCNITSCPLCGIKLIKKPHPLEKNVQILLFIPILIFLTGLIIQDQILLIISGVIFVLLAFLVIFLVNKPNYKNWQYFHEDKT